MTNKMSPNELNEYETTAEFFRHNQTLIHQGVATFVALSGPLAAVAFATNFEQPLRLLASGTGFLLSVLWFLIAVRMKIYNTNYLSRLTMLEGAYAGFMQKDNALKTSNVFLKYLPGTTTSIVFTYLFCGAFFAGLTLCIVIC